MRLLSLSLLLPVPASAQDGGEPPDYLRLELSQAEAAWGGTEARQYIGEYLRYVGDVDGNGYDDFVAGIRGFDTPTEGLEMSNAGAVAIVYGRPGLSGDRALTSAGLWMGDSAGAGLGYAVSPAGDVDGDGYDDYLGGARNDLNTHGRAWLFYGSDRRLLDQRQVGGPGSASFAGPALGAHAGDGLGPAGDLDGDGYDDFLVGSATADIGGDSDAGAVHLVYGQPTPFSQHNDLADFPTFVGDGAGDELGTRFALAHGDLDGDGLDDLIMGAADQGDDDAGAVYIWPGDSDRYSGSAAVADAGDLLYGVDTDDGSRFGYAVNAGGDLDGDGTVDLTVGAYYYDDPALDAGRSYLFYGGPDGFGTIDADDADVQVRSSSPSIRLGREVSLDGDVDGDGRADWVMGMYRWNGSARAAGAGVIFLGAGLSGAYDLDDADYLIEGFAEHGHTGYSLHAGGDIDGDGRDDLIIGSPGLADSTGSVHLFLGSKLESDEP